MMDAASQSSAAARFAAWLNAPARAPLCRLRVGRRTIAPTIGLVGLVLGACVWGLVFASSERFLAHDGLGDDGVAYGAWIAGWNWDIPEMGLSAYNTQRLLAAGLVRWLLDVRHLPVTNANIVRTFLTIDFLAVLVAWLAWLWACRALALTRAGWLFGALVAFGSFGVLKWIPFDPVLTDALALAAGSLALAFWLEDRIALLFGIGALGAFVWPSLAFEVGVLLALPRARSGVGPELPARPGKIADALAALLAAWWVALAWPFREWTPGSGVIYASRSVFLLSVALVALVLFFGVRPMARPWLLVRHARAEGARVAIGVLAGAALVLAVRAGVRWASRRPTLELSQMPDVQPSHFLDMSLFLSVQRPVAFLVAHLMFFGPWVALAVVRWPSVCRAAARAGPGVLAVLGAALLAGLNSETRRLFAVLPFVAFAVVSGLDLKWSPARLAAFAGLTVLGTRVWSTVVQQPFADLELIGACEGPWMPLGQYQLGLVVLVLVAAWGLHLASAAVPEGEEVTLLLPRAGGQA